MYRKLASAVLIASAINAKYALALGLGGMTMHSALNQPLDAEISLSSVGDLDKSQVLITLASPEDYLKAGVDRSFFLFDIKFEVVLDGKGGGVVKLRSTKRLNEPYLDLLLEAKWPSGRSLRSYTTLVDLPVYEDAPVAQVQVAEKNSGSSSVNNQSVTSDRSDSSVVKAIATQSQSSSRPASRQYTPSTYSGDQYQIQPNETLSHIANKLNPGSGATLNQTMLAIQKMNPHAFVRNNINIIKAGAVLRVPSAADVKQISTAVAADTVAEQNREWRGVQLDATGSKESLVSQDTVQDEGHLSLTSAGAGIANGKKNDSSALQQKLNTSYENLDAAKAENKELNSRVGSLNSEVSQLRRMIELKDAELAALQKKLGKDKDSAVTENVVVTPPAPVTQTDAVVKEKDNEKSIDSAKPDASADDPKNVVPVEASLPSKPVEKQVVKKKQPESKVEEAPEIGMLDKVKANPLYVGVLALILIFGVVAFLFRRKAQAERQSIQENDIANFDFDQALEDDKSQGSFDSQDITEEFEAISNIESSTNNDVDDEQPTTMQTSDPVGEAEIYIAYGRYDQAAELLSNAISKSPNNVDLRSKLLEVYVESRNKSGFQQQYLELRSLGQSSALGYAKELLSSADGVSDWLDDLPVDENIISSTSTVNSDSGFEEHLDLDLNLDDENSNVSDFSFDDNPVTDLSDDNENIVTQNDDTLDLDISDIDTDFAEDFNFSENATASIQQEEESHDFALDLSDVDLDTSDSELSFELETPKQSVESTITSALDSEFDDVSFDLPEEHTVESGSDDALSFDDIDMNFEEVSSDSPSSTPEEVAGSFDDLTFDGFDIESESVSVSSPVVEDTSLDFSDMDLSFEDAVESESMSVSSEDHLDNVDFATVESDLDFDSVADSGSELEDWSVVDESASVEQESVEQESVESGFDKIESVEIDKVTEVETPYVSTPITTLESEDLEFLTDGDEVSTKLDLAQAYVDLGDVDGARDILLEVMKEGRDDQKAEAAALLDSLD